MSSLSISTALISPIVIHCPSKSSSYCTTHAYICASRRSSRRSLQPSDLVSAPRATRMFICCLCLYCVRVACSVFVAIHLLHLCAFLSLSLALLFTGFLARANSVDRLLNSTRKEQDHIANTIHTHHDNRAIIRKRRLVHTISCQCCHFFHPTPLSIRHTWTLHIGTSDSTLLYSARLSSQQIFSPVDIGRSKYPTE